MPTPSHSIDIPFNVPQTFRFRNTRDVLGGDSHVLLDLLEPSGDAKPRVIVFVDASLPRADHEFLGRLEGIFTTAKDRVTLVEEPRAIGGGEPCKNDPALVDGLLSHFHTHNLDRRSYVVVIGGGAVLDVVGYAASIAHRGIRLIRLPSTTLAQADSGVGVKNAVNWFAKKNWKGTFAVPWGVINDHHLLRTLPQRAFLSGFSEVVKVALLKDPRVFAELEAQSEKIVARDDAASAEMIHQSVWLHLRHITNEGDPFEMLEARPLDFGHWSAHRLEALSDYHIPHGEAVAIGVAIDTLYSRNALGFPATDADRVIRCLQNLQLPVGHHLLHDKAALLAGLEEFRQHLGGRLTLTLLAAIGQPLNQHKVDMGAMHAAIDEAYSISRR
ncbi:3-dehydroquinate synthase [Planctomycetaceae bacterium SH139]